MKNTKKIILVALLMMSVGIFAQKEIKEGVVTIKTTMSSENDQVNASLAMMGDLIVTTYFKGQKSRAEMNNPMAGETTTIVDNDSKKTLMFMNNPMMGKKYVKSDITVTDEELNDISVTGTGDSKTILGYDCKGYDVVIKKDGNEVKMRMYITDKILAPTQNSAMLGGKLNGFPMYMTMDINQAGMAMTTTMEATELKLDSVDDSKFDLTIPEGYEEMAMPKM